MYPRYSAAGLKIKPSPISKYLPPVIIFNGSNVNWLLKRGLDKICSGIPH